MDESMREELLAELPAVFRARDATRWLSEHQLRTLVARGRLLPVGRGVYRKDEFSGDDDLALIATKAPHATLCLRFALAHHGLIDDIADVIDVAIPRGSWTPATTVPVRWRHFAPATFTAGRERLPLGSGLEIGIYSAGRSIVDAYRVAHLDGSDLAHEALKRWLRQGGQPSELLRTAKLFPRTQSEIRRTLEIVL